MTDEERNELARRPPWVGARIIDRVLSGTMLPELSTRLLARMAEGEPVETIEVGWDQAAGEFSYRIG